MSQAEQPLVPRAQPVYLDLRGKPAEMPASLRDSHEETKWHNPTNQAIVAEIQVASPQPGRPPRNWEEKTGLRRYVWQPGETKALPFEYGRALQQTRCVENECIQMPFACRDPEHQHSIVGGLAPMLENLGMQKRPIMHESLDDEAARLKEAERKEFDAFRRQQAAEREVIRARAEAEIAKTDIEAKVKAEAASKQQQPAKK